MSGYTAWVNGGKVTGTMAKQSSSNTTLGAGESKTYPAGYYQYEWTVTSSESPRTAHTLQLKVWQGWSDGNAAFGELTIDGVAVLSSSDDDDAEGGSHNNSTMTLYY